MNIDKLLKSKIIKNEKLIEDKEKSKTMGTYIAKHKLYIHDDLKKIYKKATELIYTGKSVKLNEYYLSSIFRIISIELDVVNDLLKDEKRKWSKSNPFLDYPYSLEKLIIVIDEFFNGHVFKNRQNLISKENENFLLMLSFIRNSLMHRIIDYKSKIKPVFSIIENNPNFGWTNGYDSDTYKIKRIFEKTINDNEKDHKHKGLINETHYEVKYFSHFYLQFSSNIVIQTGYQLVLMSNTVDDKRYRISMMLHKDDMHKFLNKINELLINFSIDFIIELNKETKDKIKKED